MRTFQLSFTSHHQNSPNNMSGMSNPPGTPRDEDVGGSYLHSFQNESVRFINFYIPLSYILQQGFPNWGLWVDGKLIIKSWKWFLKNIFDQNNKRLTKVHQPNKILTYKLTISLNSVLQANIFFFFKEARLTKQVWASLYYSCFEMFASYVA